MIFHHPERIDCELAQASALRNMAEVLPYDFRRNVFERSEERRPVAHRVLCVGIGHGGPAMR
jgi:hypothetical protein